MSQDLREQPAPSAQPDNKVRQDPKDLRVFQALRDLLGQRAQQESQEPRGHKDFRVFQVPLAQRVQPEKLVLAVYRA